MYFPLKVHTEHNDKMVPKDVISEFRLTPTIMTEWCPGMWFLNI